MTCIKQCTLLLFLSVFIFSCTKEGADGPAGANGRDGNNGSNGSNGKDGKDGKNGNANVISGAFILDNNRFARDSWTIRNGNVTVSYPAKVANVSIPSLTEDVFRNGTVLLYMKIPAGFATLPDSWVPLPHSVSGHNQGYLIITHYSYKTAMVQVYYMYQRTDNASNATVPDVTAAVVPTQEYKYVVIAGNAATNAKTKPPVDYNNYEAVKTFYQLPE